MAGFGFDDPSTHGDCMDDSHGGFGDSPFEDDSDDLLLPPLVRLQKYTYSKTASRRVMTGRIIQELLKTLPADQLANDLNDIMQELARVIDESILILRADLLDQIPHIAAQTIECSSKLGDLKNTVYDHLISIVVRNLGCAERTVDKAAHAALIQLIEQGFITKQQVEIQVCPSILALSKVENTTNVNACIAAITLMRKLSQHLGRDVMERVFLKRFTELCVSDNFDIRQKCASSFGEFCNVVGQKEFENTLLPCYIKLCEDDVWNVRKSCLEVIMYVSCSCPPKYRRDILAPAFVKLLQDEYRCVKVVAYQALGPFIATFADRALIKVAFNKNGDLILVNEEGDEFEINCFHPSSESVVFMRNRNIDDYDDDDPCVRRTEALLTDFGEPKNEKYINNGRIKYPEFQETLESIMYKIRLKKIEFVFDEPRDKQCDNLPETLDNEINKEINNLDNTANLDNGNSQNIESHSMTSIKDVNDNDKVNNADLEDDLRLFHSHVYWYISPDLPLDPSIIAGHDFPNKDDPPGYITKCLENSNSIEGTINEDSTLSLEDNCNIIDDNKTQEIFNPFLHPLPQQDVIPQPLIEHFVSMTDRDFCVDIDSSINFYCAYSLPAVALTLGKDNWDLLKDTVECLAGDMQYKIRKTVACGLHELAIILGPKLATENLTPLFDGFIKDLDEVRIGILKHLADFLQLIETEKRISYLPKLAQFLRTDNEWNWRFRYELAFQLLNSITLFKPTDSVKYLGVIVIDLLCDKVAAVREVSVLLVTKLLSYISSEPGLTPNLLIKLAEHFAHSKKWKRRQTFCLFCCELLKENILPAEQFATDVMPHLLDLSWDPVTNVRLVVARCLSQYLITNDYFTNPDNEHCDGLETVLRRLQSDKDRDVRQSAELK